MAKFIPARLTTWFATFFDTLKAKAADLRNFDWASLKHLSWSDVLSALRNPRWYKPAALIFGVLVAIHVIKNDIVIPYMKAHFALGVDVIEVQPITVPLESQLVAQTRSPQSVAIYTRVSGFLEKQVYQEGSWVLSLIHI